MNFSFSSDDFTTTTEDLMVVKTRKHNRGWKFGRGGSILGMPLFHEGLIYFGALDGILYCFNPEGKEYKWTYKTGDRIIGASPVTFENMIIIPSYDFFVYALDKNTGELIWRFRAGAEMIATPTIFDENVYITARNGFLFEIDARTGKEIRSMQFGDEFSFCPHVDENRIIVGSRDGNLYCIKRDDFSEIWRFKTGDEIFSIIKPPTKKGKILFASMDSYLYSIDIKSGKEIWRFKTGKYGNTSTPSIYGNRVYHGSRDHLFYAIDFDTGQEIWRFHTNGTIGGTALPIEQNGIIYIDSAGELFALTLDGKEIWKHKTPYDISGSTPIIYKDKLYIGMWDCYFYCLDLKTGEEYYRIPTSTLESSYIPPANEAFEIQVKKNDIFEDITEEEKYVDGNVNLMSFDSEYSQKSEYSTNSEYSSGSEYNRFMVIDICAPFGTMH